MSDLKNWSLTAGGNNDGPPDGMPENMNRTDVNDSVRELMAAIRRWYDDPTWVDPFNDYAVTKVGASVVRINGLTSAGPLVVNRRVKLSGTNPTEYGLITQVIAPGAFVAIVVEMDGGGDVPAAIDTCEICAVALNVAAFRGVVDAGESLSDTTKLVSIDGFDDVLAQSASFVALGTAADLDAGTDAANLPTVGDLPAVLGTAAFVDHGTEQDEVPLNSDLGTIATHDAPWLTVIDIFVEENQNQGAVHWDPIEWTGVEIPTADGTKIFQISLWAYMRVDQAGDIDNVYIRVGTDGDRGDNIFKEAVKADDAWYLQTTLRIALFMSCIILPETGDMLTISIRNASGDDRDRQIMVAGNNGTPEKSLLVIQEIIGE
jgi:hypothetical protein